MANFFKKTSMSIDNGARFIANIPLKILEYILSMICIMLYIVGRWFVVIPVVFFFVFQDLYSRMGFERFDIGNLGPLFSEAIKNNEFKLNAILAIVLAIGFLIIVAVLRRFFLNLRADVSSYAYNNREAITRNNKKIAELEKMGSDKDLSGYNKRKADEFKNNDNFIER